MENISRKSFLYVILGAFFITSAVVAELIGGKLFVLGPFTLSVGVLPWPIVFLLTDLINEYYGKEGVRRLSFLAVGLILFAFLIIYLAIQVPAASFSPVTDTAFSQVFRQSLWIIVGSIVAFLCGQMIDVWVFWFVRKRTGMKMLWLRATGSTLVSQFFDTFIVLGIAFLLPGHLSITEFATVGLSNYTYKIGIALSMTPFVYLFHYVIDQYLDVKKGNTL